VNTITEIVNLPDPAVQPLVHPVDVRVARRYFLCGWLIAGLSSPPVALSVAVVLWFVSSTVVGPVLAGITLVAVGHVARRRPYERAWSFIPRKRQHRQRPLPPLWDIGSALGGATLLAVTLALVATQLDQSAVYYDVNVDRFNLPVCSPGSCVPFTAGMAAIAIALIVAVIAAMVVRHRGPQRRRIWLALPGVLAILIGTGISYQILSDRPEAATSAPLWWGAITTVAVTAVSGLSRYLQTRRSKASVSLASHTINRSEQGVDR